MLQASGRVNMGPQRESPVLTNLASSYGKVTCLVSERKALGVVFLGFSKAFHTVPHRILLEELSNCGMSRYMVFWVKNWLKSRAERVATIWPTSGW